MSGILWLERTPMATIFHNREQVRSWMWKGSQFLIQAMSEMIKLPDNTDEQAFTAALNWNSFEFKSSL